MSADEAQMRFLPKSKMPRKPRESGLVDAARKAIAYVPSTMVYSGRVWCSGAVPFVPALGKGTPDLVGSTLGWFWGVEFKRDASEKERLTQQRWRAIASLAGIRVLTECTTVEAAVEFVRSIYREAAAYIDWLRGKRT